MYTINDLKIAECGGEYHITFYDKSYNAFIVNDPIFRYSFATRELAENALEKAVEFANNNFCDKEFGFERFADFIRKLYDYADAVRTADEKVYWAVENDVDGEILTDPEEYMVYDEANTYYGLQDIYDLAESWGWKWSEASQECFCGWKKERKNKGNRDVKMYYIDYQTGAGNEYADTLEQAIGIADSGAAYTQQDIVIYDNNSAIAARRPWWGVAYDPDEAEYTADEIIAFGDFGYYGAWEFFCF